MFGGKKLVIWDWNGTLLYDTAVCIQVINRMLGARDMKKISAAFYRNVFRFPVRDYYIDLGFDFTRESFEDLSAEFTLNYNQLQHKATLYPHAVALMDKFCETGFLQIVLSAMEKDALTDSIRSRGITHYFDAVLGIDNHFAAGKLQAATEYLSVCPVKRTEMIYLGDTTHDYEVSQRIGCDCLLISNGHQSPEILMKTGATVQKNLANVLNMLVNS